MTLGAHHSRRPRLRSARPAQHERAASDHGASLDEAHVLFEARRLRPWG
jgi:hypothetical protein